MISGTTIERSTSTYIAPSEKITPTGDRIILKPLKWEPSEIIETIRSGRPVRGEVLAIGHGAYQRAYNKDKSKVWETDKYVPTTLKVGDIVEIGGLNIFSGNGYSFQDVIWGNQRCLIIQEADVAHNKGLPLQDRILVKAKSPEDSVNGLYVKTKSSEVLTGEIISTGPDVKELSAGDEIGFLATIGVETTIGPESYLVMREKDVSFVVES